MLFEDYIILFSFFFIISNQNTREAENAVLSCSLSCLCHKLLSHRHASITTPLPPSLQFHPSFYDKCEPSAERGETWVQTDQASQGKFFWRALFIAADCRHPLPVHIIGMINLSRVWNVCLRFRRKPLQTLVDD